MLAFMLLVQSACLIPQQIQELNADAGPHPAPHFVLNSLPADLLVPILTLNRQGSADVATPCVCHLVITAPQVFEEDPAVTLGARWFVDYDKSVPSSQHAQLPDERIQGNLNALDSVRLIKPFTFNADQLGIFTSGIHVVEVLVGDELGFDNSATAALPFRSMLPGYESALYRYVVQVNVTQDPNQPHCALPGQDYQVCGQ